jgi:alpha/beta superfamily hydrolase
MEEKVTFISDELKIEGLLNRNKGVRGAVLTHPHPLYGGDMHNPVVQSLTAAYHQKGYSTLRFNFRGVGNSQGNFADGIGEQADVRAALAYLSNLGLKQLDLGGYSFGAWVNAHLNCEREGLAAMIMVSPPAAFVDFNHIGSIDCLKLIVTGGSDDIAPAHQISAMKEVWNPRASFEVIEGADHFYWGYTDILEEILVSNI